MTRFKSSRMITRNRHLISQICMALFTFFLLYYTGLFTFITNKICRSNEIDNVLLGRTLITNRSLPIIFIGGVPRSGTTLMRAILDSHSDVRCGEETRLLPRILSYHAGWMKSPVESKRILAAGINEATLNSAISSFLLNIILKHGEDAPRICNKDPFLMKYAGYLHTLFPNAKFIMMIRDGRAVINSIIKRKVSISGFNFKDPKGCLKRWNKIITIMVDQCKAIKHLCLMVYYERLVLQPIEEVRKILNFMDLKWDPKVLHHDKFINQPGGISLSKYERSTDQVIKPINTEALSSWVKWIPEDVKINSDTLAPMLQILGYDPYRYPPYYGEPSSLTLNNTANVLKNERYYQKLGDLVKGDFKNKKVPR